MIGQSKTGWALIVQRVAKWYLSMRPSMVFWMSFMWLAIISSYRGSVCLRTRTLTIRPSIKQTYRCSFLILRAWAFVINPQKNNAIKPFPECDEKATLRTSYVDGLKLMQFIKQLWRNRKRLQIKMKQILKQRSFPCLFSNKSQCSVPNVHICHFESVWQLKTYRQDISTWSLFLGMWEITS